MQYLPSFVADLVFPEVDKSVFSYVRLGNRVELEISSLKEEYKQPLLAYWAKCLVFWENPQEGSGEEYIVIKRLLKANRQQDKAKGSTKKVDLKPELEALEKTSLLEWVPSLFLGPKCQHEEINKRASLFSELTVQSTSQARKNSGDGQVLTLVTADNVYWPEVLGGMPSPGEIQRHIEITSNYAGWRDRKVRRFTSLKVWAEEIWPKP